MNSVYMKVISSILTILVVLVTSVLVPWIKSKMSAQQLETITKYTEYAVRCAEQIFTPDEWQDKKAWVLEYITDLINSKFELSLSNEDINTLIEGVVNEVKK